MRLDVTPQRGAVTTYTLSADGVKVVTLVNDPDNPGRPAQTAREWAEANGGTVPLNEAKRDERDRA